MAMSDSITVALAATTKSRTHGRKSRSTGTKATTRVGPALNPRTDLEEELKAL
jgi:hypothetical protein